MSETSGDNPLKIQLCAIEGKASTFIDAELLENGDLELSGQDLGEATEEFFGDSDFEYWLTIPKKEKDRLLLALLGQLYLGDPGAVGKLRKVLEAHSIPHKTHSF